MTPLPPAFLSIPLAHRALHDRAQGRPENSLEAIRAAIKAGYGIEVDVQPSSDGVAMVFHDYDLKRLTGVAGAVSQRSAGDLGTLTLIGGASGIPTLSQVLTQVAGRVPVLVELKDQDGAMGPAIGALETAVAEALRGYAGDVALMSFNPFSVAALAGLVPDRPRGLTTCAYRAEDWPLLPAATRDRLRDIPDFDAVDASFVSHNVSDLGNPAITALRSRKVPVLCWTVRSAQAEAEARKVADNITFEGYAAALPGA